MSFRGRGGRGRGGGGGGRGGWRGRGRGGYQQDMGPPETVVGKGVMIITSTLVPSPSYAKREKGSGEKSRTAVSPR